MGTHLRRFACLWVTVALGIPALAQQRRPIPPPPPPPSSRPVANADKPYCAVWLTGEQGKARAGVVFLCHYRTGGVIDIKDGTTVAAPDGKVWDLGTPVGFMNFGLTTPMFTIVSPTGRLEDVTIGAAIIGYMPIGVKVDAQTDLILGNSKIGTQTIKAKVTGALGITSKGDSVLLPVAGFYSARGTIVTSISKSKQTTLITATTLGLLSGKLTLGLVGFFGGRATVAFPLPEFVSVASQRGVYHGQVLAVDNFGFANVP